MILISNIEQTKLEQWVSSLVQHNQDILGGYAFLLFEGVGGKKFKLIDVATFVLHFLGHNILDDFPLRIDRYIGVKERFSLYEN